MVKSTLLGLAVLAGIFAIPFGIVLALVTIPYLAYALLGLLGGGCLLWLAHDIGSDILRQRRGYW